MSLCSLLACCDSKVPSAELTAGEREIIELNLRIELLQYRLQSRSTTDDAGTLRELDDKLKHLAAVRDTHQAKIETLLAEIATLRNDFDNSRVTMIKERRRTTIGLAMDRMTTRHGRVFMDVTITDVGDEGVSIRHRTGTATLRYKHLTDDQRARFGMDEELSQLAEQREHSETLAWHAWVESEASIMHQRGPSPGRFNQSAPVASIAAAIPSRRTSPLAEPARPFGTASRYRTYRPRYRTVYYYTPAQPCPPAQPYQLPRQSPIHQLHPWPHCGK